MSALYLETSALLRILLSQNDSKELLSRFRKAKRVMTSRLTRIEAERALIRLSMDLPEVERVHTDLSRDLRGLFATLDVIEMDANVCELAGRISPRSRLRSLDAIHLATFRILRRHLGNIEMLTSDERIQAELDSAQ